jgi:alkylhydroperoxidase family enzyme
VPDDIWAAIADHCDESQLVAMVLNIAITNFFNRINTAAKEPAGTNWA